MSRSGDYYGEPRRREGVDAIKAAKALLRSSGATNEADLDQRDVSAARLLSTETRKLLTGVVRRLVADCVDFYRNDQAILEQMSEDALEFAVRDYLAKADWYSRGLTNAK